MEVIQAIRGTRDILPEETPIWQHVEACARKILQRARYQEIRTPIFEVTELFARSIGEATDVVGKEMYSFTTRGEKEITLRPENTAGVVRAYIQHKLYASGDAQRLWYTGPMFRYERPQKGRQRQFHQLGVELIGTRDPRADTEVIAVAIDILQDLGVPNLKLLLNSIGNLEDRDHYRQALTEFLTPYQTSLDPDSQERLTRNPLRILDSKDPKTQEILLEAPNILNYLSDDSRQHFEHVQIQLNLLEIPYQLEPRLVRGLDYYTHTAFEIQAESLGSQSAVGGGGRYDGLIQELGGPTTPAVGWAIGLERLVLLLQEIQLQTTTDIYVVSKGTLAQTQALVLAQQLRQAGFTTELDLSGSAFSKQFKRASRSQAIWALTLGEEEAQSETVQIKQLDTGDQATIAQADVVTRLQQLQAGELV